MRRVVEYVRATTPRGRRVDLHLLTNGTRLGEDAIAFLAGHRVSVQISIDGAEAAQRLRGAGTFRQIDSLVSHLRRRHRTWFRNRVNAAVTLVPGTIPLLAASVDYLLNRGFTDITLSPATGDIPGWHDGLLPLLDAQFRLVYRSSLRRYRRTGLVPLSLFRKGTPSPYPPWSARCGVESGRSAVVDVDGQVYGCAPVVGSALDRPAGLLRAASDAMRIGDVIDPGLGGRLPAYRDALAATGLFGPREGGSSSTARAATARTWVLRRVPAVDRAGTGRIGPGARAGLHLRLHQGVDEVPAPLPAAAGRLTAAARRWPEHEWGTVPSRCGKGPCPRRLCRPAADLYATASSP